MAARAPAAPFVSHAPRKADAMAYRAPDLLLPAAGGVARDESSGELTVQRVEAVAAPASGSGPAPAAEGPAARPGGDIDAAAYEVHLLAHEVWSLLKRRLAVEAERTGRW